PFARLAAGHERRVNVDTRPQTATAYLGDTVADELAQAVVQHRTEHASAFLELTGAQQIDHRQADRARERVAAEGGAVLARLQHAEHVGTGDDRRDRHHAAA